ncbi:MAG: hypothetical protein LBC18_00950 [Opitutaceae bacterium]|nr:hypothetical protein [Opitutaceae bacterium]
MSAKNNNPPNPAPAAPGRRDSLDKLAHWLLVFLGAAVLLMIPFKVAGTGYLPGDDALRHAAFAVDNRAWSEVLVLNPALDPAMDSHPGWHAMLRLARKAFYLNQDGLVMLSFTLTLAGFMLAGLAASRAPLAWIVTGAIMLVIEPGLYSRLLLGRPFAVSMTVLVVLLFLWSRPEKRTLRKDAPLTFLLLTVSVVMHPTVWYLWSVPILALWLAGRRRQALLTAACVPCAMLAAALLLRDWYDIFVFPLFLITNSVDASPIVATNLVTEFQPAVSPVFSIALVAAILAVRKLRGGSLSGELRQADFLTAIIGWLLGLAYGRFLFDWGLPALMVWLCRQLAFVDRLALREKGIAGAVGLAALYLGLGADLGGRYSQNLKTVLTRPVGEFQDALPDPGGILYSSDMTAFYSLYYRLPRDHNFRYILGYESGMMPVEDLRTLRAIQTTNGALAEHEPWFAKMSPADRILITALNKPEKEGFEFARFFNYWIGRKLPPPPAAPGAPAAPPGRRDKSRHRKRRELAALHN